MTVGEKKIMVNVESVSFSSLPPGIPPKNNGLENGGSDNRLLFPFLLKISSCWGKITVFPESFPWPQSNYISIGVFPTASGKRGGEALRSSPLL